MIDHVHLQLKHAGQGSPRTASKINKAFAGRLAKLAYLGIVSDFICCVACYLFGGGASRAREGGANAAAASYMIGDLLFINYYRYLQYLEFSAVRGEPNKHYVGNSRSIGTTWARIGVHIQYLVVSIMYIIQRKVSYRSMDDARLCTLADQSHRYPTKGRCFHLVQRSSSTAAAGTLSLLMPLIARRARSGQMIACKRNRCK